MGSSSDKKKDKKAGKKRRRSEEGGRQQQEQEPASHSRASTNGSGSGGGKRRKVSVQLATGVPSADSREQDKADPLTLPPILATFPHGNPRDLPALRFTCRATAPSGGQRQRRRLLLKAETAHVSYEGEGPAVARKARAKFVVGVYSKSRRAVTLYPVESLLALEQRVKGLPAEADEEAEAATTMTAGAAAAATAMSYTERRRSLVDTFGSKKKKRVMQSQEENRIRAEGVVGLGALGGFLADSVRAVKAEAAAQGQELSAAEASRAALLPPYDARASSADRVYSAKRVLPGPDAWEGVGLDLQQLAGTVTGGLGSEVDGEALRAAVLGGWKHWPAFLKGRVQDAPMPTSIPEAEAGTTDARWEHLCALLLLRHLFDLHRLPPVLKGGAAALAQMLGGGVGEDAPANEALAEACLEAFFEQGEQGGGGGRHARTKPLTDKLLLHILVLCLIVGGYRVSATKIAQDLRMSPGDCATLFRETGATVKRVYGGGRGGEEGGKGKGKGGEEVVVELNVPLKFPEVKRVMRAKK